jgi:hypothetical protein
MAKIKEKEIIMCEHDITYICEGVIIKNGKEKRDCFGCFRYSAEYLKNKGKTIKERVGDEE